MAFNRTGLRKIAFLGTLAADSRPRVLYGYDSADSIATQLGANYFDDLINELGVGDKIIIGGGSGADVALVTVTSVTSHVAVSQAGNAVAGDQTAIPDLTLTSPTDTPASADALRDDLNTNVLPPIVAKINAVLAMMRTAGLIASS